MNRSVEPQAEISQPDPSNAAHNSASYPNDPVKYYFISLSAVVQHFQILRVPMNFQFQKVQVYFQFTRVPVHFLFPGAQTESTESVIHE